MVGDNNLFTKTICSICYEDLKPIIEDLQSISVCGHVFHEICLQQWFEYCPKGKRRSCPVCNQNCTNANVGRLYFQSVGDSNDANLSQKSRGGRGGEVPEEFRSEINRLEGKANALASTLELQQRELKEVNDQLVMSKEQLTIEVRLKNEALTQKANIQQLLRVKSEELDKYNLECMRMKEMNMALAKELAAMKLVSDLNLEEEDVLRLASLGHDAGSKETADVLKKSLIMRNKSYKELMAKCNTLGRGEAQCLRKLEKACGKIKKLKLRVQELETAVEMKDNEALRVLKKQDCKHLISSQRNTLKGPTNQASFDKAAEIPDISFSPKNVEPIKPMVQKKSVMNDVIPSSFRDQNDPANVSVLINVDEDVLSSAQVPGFSCERLMPCSDNSAVTKSCHVSKQNATFDIRNEIEMLIPCNQNGTSCSGNEANKPPADIDDEIECFGDVNPVKSAFHIRKESGSSASFTKPGGNCFSGGLLGPDGTNWHLGKWCKKVQISGSTSERAGDLIAVGADGRGGKIKVMRSLDQSSMDIWNTPSLAKKCKSGAKTNGLQQQGHLRIEHFFQRKDQ